MEKLQLSTVCTPTDKRNNTVMDTSIRTEMFFKIKGYIYKKAAPTGEDRGRYSEYRDLLRYALSDISPKHSDATPIGNIIRRLPRYSQYYFSKK